MTPKSTDSSSCSGSPRQSQIFEGADGQLIPWPDDPLLIRRYENVLARKLFEQGCRFAKICGQNIHRIASNPRRKMNRLEGLGVKIDQDPPRHRQ
jgi:hypothetical protein